MSENINEIIDYLTENGKYATDICLFLLLKECETSLYYLKYLDIKGKDLENLIEKCVIEFDLNYITQTIRYLRSGFLDKKDIFDNIHSNNSINFIPRLLIVGEDWEFAYENFTSDFYKRYNKNNNKR